MDREESERVSARYSIYGEVESGVTNRSDKGYDWQSTVSHRSKHSRRSVGKERRNICEAILLGVVIGVAATIMWIPALVYPILGVPVPNATNTTGSGICGNIDWEEVPSSQGQPGCMAMAYNSGVCYDQLADWQGCVSGQNVSVTINSSSDISQLMTDAGNVITALSMFGSEECKQIALPFVCAYLFSLCDSGSLYLPTSQECFNLSTDVCASEWNLALTSPYAYLLPNCSQLPGKVANSTISNLTNITCKEGFYVNGSACIPNCREWNEFSETGTLVQNVVLVASATLGLICGILVVTGSCIRHHVMCRFPYVFLVLMSLGYCVLAIGVILSFADRSLYCTSDNIYNVYTNSSAFCTITGASFHYFLPNITYFWLFHICSMFIKLFLPHWTQHHPTIVKSINLSFCLLAFVLPIPAVVWTVVQNRYTVSSFPPVFCFPSDINLFYFTCILIINILLVIGVVLYILLFWKLHKIQADFASSSPLRWRRWMVYLLRQRIMIFIGYYFLLGTFVLIAFEINVQDFQAFLQNITLYFACEQDGLPNNCTRDVFARYTHIYLSTFSYALLSLLTFFHLLYVINWKYIATKCCQKRIFRAQLVMPDEQNTSSFTPNSMEVRGSSFTSTM